MNLGQLIGALREGRDIASLQEIARPRPKIDKKASPVDVRANKIANLVGVDAEIVRVLLASPRMLNATEVHARGKFPNLATVYSQLSHLTIRHGVLLRNKLGGVYVYGPDPDAFRGRQVKCQA